MIARLGFVLAAAVSPETLDGIWQSIGHGNIYRIRGPQLEAFEVTSTTCLASDKATQSSNGTFRIAHGATFTIAPDSAGRFLLLQKSSLAKLRLVRISAMPPACTEPPQNTPTGNFEVFTNTMAEHYNAFDERHIDWSQLAATQRAKISGHTTPSQLFAMFESMLAPLGDLHTGLGAPSLKRGTRDFFRQGTDRLIQGNVNRFAKSGRRALFAITEKAHPMESKREFCRGQVIYAKLPGGIGYLRLLSFGDWGRRGKDRDAIDHAMDRILADPTLRALILDLRLSFGGDDALGLALAARLTRERYLAFSIQARADHADRHKWSEPDDVFVEPTRRAAFTGPVIALTSPITMSAAETFLLALIGRVPRVTRIGEPTQGVFCDPLERHLPNGWTFALPNAVYRTAAGEAFDARGIPPGIAAPVFADGDVAQAKDPAMEAAVRLLTRH
ncbi:MAG: S41 family peptidase [Bryobacteraceae bacterium]